MATDATETAETVETEYDAEPLRLESESAAPASPSGRDGVGGFLKRLFLAFIKVSLALLVLVGLAFGAWLLFIEINRSFDSVATRIDRNVRRIEETEAQINALQEQNYARQVQVTELETALATREAQMDALEEELGATLEQQGNSLADVSSETETLSGRADTLAGETAFLGEGLVVLQEDLNANGQQIDQLGGTVDGLSQSLADLDGRTAEVQEQVDALANEDLAGWRRAITLFRAWEMIGRARLRLLESNLGLAAADIDLAIAAIDSLADGETGEVPEDLVPIRERLLLAGVSLPDQPLVAGRDLETAWEALDIILAGAVVTGADGE